MMELSYAPSPRLIDPLARLQAALADRYTIERELGRGGMATVYLAQDLKHHRQVAIKVLRPELAAARDRELPDAVARRSWVLRGVTCVGVAEEARTRSFVSPALAGFAFLAAGRACCDVKYRAGSGASSSSRSQGPRPLLRASQLRQLGYGCLVVIDPCAHRVRRPFGTQAIRQLAGALLLAGLRPRVLDPDAGRRFRCIAPTFREEILPLGILQRQDVLPDELRLDGVSRDHFLVAVHDEDIGVLPHPRSLLLVKRGQVTFLRQAAVRLSDLGDDFPSRCLVLPDDDVGQGDDEKSHRQHNEDLAVLHSRSPFATPPYFAGIKSNLPNVSW